MKKLRAADLFCGAGGSTQGAVQSGRVKVLLAVNHWKTAIYSHKENHRDTRHICARIDDIDPRHDKSLPELDLLLASPECTHHSIARGGRPIEDQKRATPWHVVIWAEAKRPKWIVVENVREFRDWGPLTNAGRPHKRQKGKTFRAWIKALESLGYQVDHQVLNAADYGAATKRNRLFIIARRGDSRKDIPFPERTHDESQWVPAWKIIDWSRPCQSIFARPRPLAEKTLRRIEIGLRKFVGQAAEPFIVKMRGTGTAGSVEDPLPTVTAGGTHLGVAAPYMVNLFGKSDAGDMRDPMGTATARNSRGIAVPFLVKYHGGTDPKRDGTERSIDPKQPLPTIDTNPRFGLATPFIVPQFGEREGQHPRTHDPNQPLPTVTGHGAGAVAVPFLASVNHGGHDHRTNSVEVPLNTITCSKSQSLILPFLTKYHGTGGADPVTDPLSTVTTKHRHGLAMVKLVQTMRELGVVDIGFRMLDVDELARAQGFPERYVLYGTKAEQIRQIGNAVPPPFTEAICRTLAA